MPDSTIEKQQIVSRLMDFLDGKLDKEKKKINWLRSCYEDGNYHFGECLDGRKDTYFQSSYYTAGLFLGGIKEIDLQYNVAHEDESSHFFGMRFTEWARIGLDPIPKDIVLFSKNPDSEVVEMAHLPTFQTKYHAFLDPCYEEAKVAMHDFADSGERLAEYFVNMREESLQRYLALVRRLQQYKNDESIMKVCVA